MFDKMAMISDIFLSKNWLRIGRIRNQDIGKYQLQRDQFPKLVFHWLSDEVVSSVHGIIDEMRW